MTRAQTMPFDDTYDFFWFAGAVAQPPDPVAEFGCPNEDRLPPSMPTKYSAFVSANLGDAAATVSYRESFDAAAGVLRFEGRQGSADTVDVITATAFNRFSASGGCVAFPNSIAALPVEYLPLGALLASPLGTPSRAAAGGGLG
jgi:hypothetical protein